MKRTLKLLYIGFATGCVVLVLLTALVVKTFKLGVITPPPHPYIVKEEILRRAKYSKDEWWGTADPEKQNFENKIKQLLFLGANNRAGRFASVEKIKMADRRKYFSEQGWEEYKIYEKAHKEILRGMAPRDSYPGYHAGAMLKSGSQKYTEEKGQETTFHATGRFIYAVYEAYGQSKPFEITVTYNTDGAENVDSLLISSWQVNIGASENSD